MGGIAKGRNSGYVPGVDVKTPSPAPQPQNQTPTPPQVNTTNTKYSDFINMSDKDVATFMRNIMDTYKDIMKGTSGMNNSLLQTLTHVLGLHEKPVVAPDNEFDDAVYNNALDRVVLYRGYGYQSDSAVVDSVKYGDITYQGYGVHGDGTYLSTNANYVKSNYAGGDYKYSTITAFIDKDKARVVSESDIRRMYSRDTTAIHSAFPAGDSGLSSYALYKGYNVIYVKGGNGGRGNGDFYVPLTREPLVIREHTKLKQHNT